MRGLDLRGVRIECGIPEQSGRLLEKKGSCGGIHVNSRFWNQSCRPLEKTSRRRETEEGFQVSHHSKSKTILGIKPISWNPIVLLIREP